METEKILAAIQKAADTIATPNWAAIASVAISLFAVVVAGFVAWKQNKIVLKQAEIAEQQNKIVLFEKRYDVYETARKLVRVAEKIPNSKNTDAVYGAFQDMFEEWPSREVKDVDEFRRTFLFSIYGRLDPAEFLFSKDVYHRILFLQADLLLLICTMRDNPLDMNEFEMRITKFCESAEKIKSQKILEKMETDLQLHSIKL